MTTILATATALILGALLVGQVRKTRAAVKKSDLRYWQTVDAEHERDEARCELAAAKIQLGVARKQRRRVGEMALQHAVACERAENERDEALARCLPVAPVRTADDVLTKPWPTRKPFPVEPDGVLTLGTVTPIKRVRR